MYDIFCLFKANIQKPRDLIDTSMTETYNQLPLMKFVDKTERRVKVTNLDSSHTFWILFVHDSINVCIYLYILILIFEWVIIYLYN